MSEDEQALEWIRSLARHSVVHVAFGNASVSVLVVGSGNHGPIVACGQNCELVTAVAQARIELLEKGLPW